MGLLFYGPKYAPACVHPASQDMGTVSTKGKKEQEKTFPRQLDRDHRSIGWIETLTRMKLQKLYIFSACGRQQRIP
jgi:hypothetical protein